MEDKKIGLNESSITKELMKISDTLSDAYKDLMIGKGDKSFSSFRNVSKYKQDEAYFRGKKLLSSQMTALDKVIKELRGGDDDEESC
tara:strand:+ start:65 stop:325 length:261 start_codon:yes stop_codon:yes gene_type:complete